MRARLDTPPTEPTEQPARTLPPPVRVGLGLVATGVERAKEVHLADIATLPVRGLGFLARARERAERTYEEMSNRGETVIARWRGRPEPRQTAKNNTAPVRRPDQTGIRLPDTIAGAVGNATPGAVLTHDKLPLDDYDHLTLGSLRARLSKLDAVALVQLRDYERVHANRLPVITMLDNRIAKITQ